MANKPWHKKVAGNYLGMPFDVLDRDAYRTASHRAKDVLSAIHRSFNGFNNGKIAVSRDQIAERIGSANHAANRRAIGELVARGLLAIERVYPKGSRNATEYRLTYVSTGDGKSETAPTKDYLDWQPGDAGSGNKRRFITEHETALSGSTTAHDRKPSGSITAPRNHSSPPSSGSITAQHIDYQGGRTSSDPKTVTKLSGGVFGDEPVRPQSVTEDRWLLAGRNAAANPAGPEPKELRKRVADFIQVHGKGSQTRLAKQAGIIGGTFSRFLKGELDMTNRHRMALACTIGKAAAAEKKLRPPKVMNGGVR